MDFVERKLQGHRIDNHSPPSLSPRPLPLSAAASSLLDPGRSRNAAPYLPKEEDVDPADRKRRRSWNAAPPLPEEDDDDDDDDDDEPAPPKKKPAARRKH